MIKLKAILPKNSRRQKTPIIFLDYDGTLVPFHENPDECAPDAELAQILHQLAVKAKLVVISGRKAATLEEWLDEFNIDLIAEHGYKNQKELEVNGKVNGDFTG